MAMKPDAKTAVVPVGKSVQLPDAPPAGTGNMTLADLCSQYNLNMKIMVRVLEEKGIQAKTDQTIKEIADQNQTGPMDIYEAVKSAANDMITQSK